MINYIAIPLKTANEKHEAQIAVDTLEDTWEERYNSVAPKYMPEVKKDVLIVPKNKAVVGALIGCFEDEIDIATDNIYNYRHSISPVGKEKQLTDQIKLLSDRKATNQKLKKEVQSKCK